MARATSDVNASFASSSVPSVDLNKKAKKKSKKDKKSKSSEGEAAPAENLQNALLAQMLKI